MQSVYHCSLSLSLSLWFSPCCGRCCRGRCIFKPSFFQNGHIPPIESESDQWQWDEHTEWEKKVRWKWPKWNYVYPSYTKQQLFLFQRKRIQTLLWEENRNVTCFVWVENGSREQSLAYYTEATVINSAFIDVAKVVFMFVVSAAR